ncbi:MAG: hypothetical protein HC897_03500 [Thermoanaerobaculia bacterium]|nr:hypothetical protein [Thermoanaerobaculia bacterium]
MRGRSALDAGDDDRSPPRLKIVLSFREDFLADLEELTRQVPGLLRNRFRLGALSREGARAAILEPARIEDDAFGSVPFTFRQEAVEQIVAFLGRRRLGKETIETEEVEPVQLQLICQYVEEQVRRRQTVRPTEIEISDADLGGEEHMRRVLESYYDRILAGLGSRAEIRAVRRLCETRLISPSGRRLTEDEEEIEARFGISKQCLSALVDCRLLRAEPRLGGTFYELSHDTLVAPILSSRSKRQARRKTFAMTMAATALLALAVVALAWWQYLKTGYEYRLQREVAATKDQYEARLDQSQQEITEIKLQSFGNLAGDGEVDDLEERGAIDERLEADRERQALLARSRPQSRQARISVRYFAKSADGFKVAAALSEVFDVVPGDPKVEVATNYIGFGGEVPIDDVRLVAYTLMRAGVEIKAIWPFPPEKVDDPRYARQIAVGANTRPEALSHAPWTVAEVRDAATFSREP